MQQLEGLLQSSAVVVGLRYQGLTVKQLQEFRRSLPQESKMLVCKVRPCGRQAGCSRCQRAEAAGAVWACRLSRGRLTSAA